MAKKKNTSNLDEMLEKAYWFLKIKLKFDDIQAATTLASIFLLPISLYLGILNYNELIARIFYITIGLDVLVATYSIVKIKYFKGIRLREKKEAKPIKVNSMSIINELSGLDFERFASEYFRILGYSVEETSGSHDNGADLIITKNNKRTCVEVKRRSSKITRHVVLSVSYAKDFVYHAHNAVIFTNNLLTDQARAAAKDKEVDYIDKYKIEKFLLDNSGVVINNKNK